MEYTQNSLHHV